MRSSSRTSALVIVFEEALLVISRLPLRVVVAASICTLPPHLGRSIFLRNHASRRAEEHGIRDRSTFWRKCAHLSGKILLSHSIRGLADPSFFQSSDPDR